jgi:cyclic pyranopterin monophosphate synthase
MLSHIDKKNLPTMVDVSDKEITERTACAQSEIQLPPEMKPYFTGEELVLKKGPVFQTAIIAGTMAVKKTAEIIPFCHPLAIEGCKITITHGENLLVKILCEVKTTGKTGVEMEALHGAMIAALTIYDMCKAVSHNMVIGETKLLSKTGGKHTLLNAPLYGLVLTGGKSTRMQKDKALLEYRGKAHAEYLRDTLAPFCEEVYLSARAGQWKHTALAQLPTVEDEIEDQGPIAGLLSAFAKHPNANWFVVACDLPFFDAKTARHLIANFDSTRAVTCYRNKDEDFPEALCAIYTPQAQTLFRQAFAEDLRCPVKVIKKSNAKVLDPKSDLANINTPEQFVKAFREVKNEIRPN